ncbi:unnamed protein product [Arabidopsis thaliana]|uniref:(thale cress) hypothetical protein n=1 Tax=Arabidopsis thaliana TaxID=3702 RepID=A0A7G2EBW5_ARATH|nr:unnamed protein product [Arabidopsis thaliana]
MGFSDAGIYLSDPNNLCQTELGFFHEPSLGFSDQSDPQNEFHITPPIYQELQDQDLEPKSQETNNCSRKEGATVKKEEEEEDDYCKTPTRSDQILSAMPRICPPAPRKPKRVPSRSLKYPFRSTAFKPVLTSLVTTTDHAYFAQQDNSANDMPSSNW